jgi:HlyD family secretion protein
MKRALIPLLILVIAAAAGGIYTYRQGVAEKSGITVSGTIETTTVAASFRIPGRLRERLADEGQTVQQGQLIARLEDDDLSQEVARRQAEVQATQAQLAELQAGSLKEEIARAEATLAAAGAEEQRLKADFARQEALLAREVISRRDFDAVRAAYDAAQAHVREARASLALVRQGPRRERIDQARGRLKEAKAAQDLATSRYSYSILTAPTSGVVLSKHAEPGEQLATGAPVITIGRLDSVWLRAYITETDLGRIKVGQQATIKTDTYPGRAYPGVVSFIASEAEFTPKNIQTRQERVKLVYRIKIDLANPKQELKPGMPADAEIKTE